MKKAKQILSLLLVLIFLLGLLPGAALAGGDPAASVTLNKRTLELTVGGTETLHATVEPEESTDTVYWVSDDTEETSYVSSVAYGNTKGGDSGVNVNWNAEKEQYDIALPDNRPAKIQIWVYGNESKRWKTVHGTTVSASYAMGFKTTLHKYIKPDLLPIGRTYDFTIQVGSTEENNKTFTEEPQVYSDRILQGESAVG